MTKELKQEYTLRITQANKTQLITILYEMTLLYIDEAKDALDAGNRDDFKNAIRRIQGCMCELMDSLHLEYEVAQNLLQIYLFINREVAKSALYNSSENLEHIRPMVEKLAAAYKQIEGQDQTGPVMGNTQTVYAGLTYGRENLMENITDPGANRGFCV